MSANLTRLLQTVSGGGKVLGPQNLGRKLWDAAQGGSNPVLIAISALATAFAALDVEQPTVHQMLMVELAYDSGRMEWLREIWEVICKEIPLLAGKVDPLLSWMDEKREADDQAVGRCFAELAEVNLAETMFRGCNGDLLGGVTYDILKRADPRWPDKPPYTGIYLAEGVVTQSFDWVTLEDAVVATAIYAHNFNEGDLWGDVLCKDGSMALGMIYNLRERGVDPNKMHWFLADPSECNVALTALNIVFLGGLTENVTLLCGADVELPKGAKTAKRPQPPRKPK